MKKVPTIDFGAPSSYSSITRQELNKIKEKAIRIWHFERLGNGVVPVKGEYDPKNPNHVSIRKVIHERRYGKWTKFKE